MAQGTLKIHSENILPIIKKSLYSDKEIFIRELVSNASDAITKLHILIEKSEAEVTDHSPKITVQIDSTAKTITITDTGLGMSAAEIEMYIAQIAFSGAEEFVKKYDTSNDKDKIIGHFGLGFYSAFMVSREVEVISQSHNTSLPSSHWISDGSNSYELNEIKTEPVGTKIVLHIDSESEEFLEESKLEAVIKKYCAFLPHPIFVGEKQINEKAPLYLKSPQDCTDEEYKDFYAELYPFQPAPIFWIHLNIDYPFNLKGIIYFPKVTERLDFGKCQTKLFCNRVFVSDDIKELLPEYMALLKGAIDSPDLPLNVSRSYLHMDKTVRQLGSHLSKKISDKLQQLYSSNKEEYIALYKEMEVFLKLGNLQDDKFYERTKDLILFENSHAEWVSIQEYLDAMKEKTKSKVYYHIDTSETHFLKLFKDHEIDVLRSTSPIDNHLFQHIESKLSEVKFQRIDGGIDDSFLQAEEHAPKEELLQFAKDSFKDQKIEVELKPLSSTAVPGFVLIDEDQRRFRDYMRLQKQDFSQELFGKKTFVLNSNSPMVSKIEEIQKDRPELAKDLLEQLYDLSLLSQKELGADALQPFLSRSMKLFESLLLK
ncbi:MAG: molecular chaperone HtpG [Chlamydiia bacterium]